MMGAPGFGAPAAGLAVFAGAGFGFPPAADFADVAGAACPKAIPVANIPPATIHQVFLVRIVVSP